jgi:hypothetical protein
MCAAWLARTEQRLELIGFAQLMLSVVRFWPQHRRRSKRSPGKPASACASSRAATQRSPALARSARRSRCEGSSSRSCPHARPRSRARVRKCGASRRKVMRRQGRQKTIELSVLEPGGPNTDARYATTGTRGMRNMHHFYPRGAFYLACMAAGVVLMLLFYFRSGQFWALGLAVDLRLGSYARAKGARPT